MCEGRRAVTVVQPRRVAPLVDPAAADLGTLVQLGRVEPPPVPSPEPPRRSSRWGPAPEPGLVEQASRLREALVEAGVQLGTGDAAAVEALAGLDPVTVQKVAAWIGRGKTQGGGGRG